MTLSEYAQELGLSTPLSLDSLINSHRRLREQANGPRLEHRKLVDTMYRKLQEEAKEEDKKATQILSFLFPEESVKEVYDRLSSW